MYPPGRFDHDYYIAKHVPLVQARWGGMGLQGAQLLKGVAAPGGGAPGFQVIANLTFESPASFDAAVAAHGAEVMGDIPNFTEVQPAIQISEPFG
jgi:uncharacterized protein (TIGR02118 family)